MEAGSFSITGVCRPCQTHPVIAPSGRGHRSQPGPTCSGCSKSIRCDATPIVCSTCQRQFHRTRSCLTRSSKGTNGFVCAFCSGSAAALSPTMTVTRTTVLPRQCLLCHTKIRHGIRPIMFQQCIRLAHRSCSGISHCAANLSWLADKL